MRIALINENSQAGKNEIIYRELKGVVEPMGHVVDNYGMYSADDEAQLTYVQCGILASLLLSSGAAHILRAPRSRHKCCLLVRRFGRGRHRRQTPLLPPSL